MKKIFYTLLCLCIFTTVHAQYPIDAQDFTATDIEGNEHNLFEHLEDGKLVILDVSATWCPPCWDLHQTHALENIHKVYGPDGTNQVVVLFYEGDPKTTLDDLKGTGSSTIGDWLTGSSYPFFNENVVEESFLDLYAPLGFPTLNIIDPTSKQIVADPWDKTEAEIIDIFEPLLLTASSVNDAAVNFNISPNPTTGLLKVDIEDIVDKSAYIQVFDQLGSLKITKTVSELEGNQIDLNNLDAGHYMIKIVNDTNISSKLIVKI